MKNISLILSILVLTNCGVKKKVISEQQKLINSIEAQDYVVTLPGNWKYILDVHDFLYFMPKEFKEDLLKNRIDIYKSENKKDTTLTAFADNKFKLYDKNYKIELQNISTEQTKFGETLIYKFDQYWNSNHLVNEIKFFKHEDDYYSFTYSSVIIHYEQYLPEANFIFDNLNFKASTSNATKRDN